MKVIQQGLVLPILPTLTTITKRNPKHNNLFPNSVRCIICGPSGSGKSTAVISLLLGENGVKFENLYIFSKSLFQPLYKLLESIIQQIKEIGFYVFTRYEDLVQPEEAKPNSVFIFDDVAWEEQNKILSFFSMGRHRDLDVFYLTQSYARLPKHLLRDNASMLVVFKQDNLNLKHIFEDHVISDMSLTDFQKLCQMCWKQKNGFLTIYKDNDLNHGRYRQNFDKFICI